MIKDIIVNLEHRIARDPARDFAITIAETFDAHVAGAAFSYTPDFPGYVMLEIPSNIVAQVTAESEKAALAAIERFEAAARRSLVASEHPPVQGDRGVRAVDPVETGPAFRSQRFHAIRAERRGQR
jgi:hypothetical protein